MRRFHRQVLAITLGLVIAMAVYGVVSHNKAALFGAAACAIAAVVIDFKLSGFKLSEINHGDGGGMPGDSCGGHGGDCGGGDH